MGNALRQARREQSSEKGGRGSRRAAIPPGDALRHARLGRSLALPLIGAASLWQVAAAGAQGPCASTADCLRALEAAQRETQTITARFVQTKRVSLLDEPLVSSGRFYFKRPDRARWELEQPQAATVIIDGSTLRMPDLPAAERRELANVPVPTMMTQLSALFTGSVQALVEHFEATAREEGGMIAVHLVPRDESWRRAFRHIDVSFSRPDLLIANIALENSLGDRVEIAFHDVVRNAPVADELFTASEPEKERQ